MEGSLAGQYATDSAGATTERYAYEYDSLGRFIHSRETDGSGNLVQRTEHLYDTSNRLTAQNWTFGGGTFGQKYIYRIRASNVTGSGFMSSIISGFSWLFSQKAEAWWR